MTSISLAIDGTLRFGVRYSTEFSVGAPVRTDNLPCEFFDPCVLVVEYCTFKGFM